MTTIELTQANYFAAIPFAVLDMGLTPLAERLYLRLVRYAHRAKSGNVVCWPGRGTLIDSLGGPNGEGRPSGGAFSRARNELQARGLITWQGEDRRSCTYFLLLPGQIVMRDSLTIADERRAAKRQRSAENRAKREAKAAHKRERQRGLDFDRIERQRRAAEAAAARASMTPEQLDRERDERRRAAEAAIGAPIWTQGRGGHTVLPGRTHCPQTQDSVSPEVQGELYSLTTRAGRALRQGARAGDGEQTPKRVRIPRPDAIEAQRRRLAAQAGATR